MSKPKRRYHHRGRWLEYGFEWWTSNPRRRTLVVTFGLTPRSLR